ncbi:MAG: cell division protein SepF [Candidatus Woesearchaeota archaeon]
MKNAFLQMKEKVKRAFSKGEESEAGKEDYVEISESADAAGKVLVRTYVLEDFEDVKPILDDLREGRTIALVNIRPLKDKDIVELKRAINKIKKTVDALEGDVAGFGEDYIVVTPNFAQIYRSKATESVEEAAEE